MAWSRRFDELALLPKGGELKSQNHAKFLLRSADSQSVFLGE
jgi:hypothetical protein